MKPKANALAPNWGQTIFQSANEIAANTMLRKRLDDITNQTEAEKEWWAKRQGAAGIEQPAASSPTTTTSESLPATSKETPGSSEDGILVEDDVPESSTPAPAAPAPVQTPSAPPSEPGTPSSKKKKKGKK